MYNTRASLSSKPIQCEHLGYEGRCPARWQGKTLYWYIYPYIDGKLRQWGGWLCEEHVLYREIGAINKGFIEECRPLEYWEAYNA